MASSDQMCSYSNITGYLPQGGGSIWGDLSGADIFHKPNKRVICPECGRKMWAARRTCHDGCCAMYCVPPHKKKGWWRIGKTKKTSRDRRGRLGRRD
jgi:hypothetical protein